MRMMRPFGSRLWQGIWILCSRSDSYEGRQSPRQRIQIIHLAGNGVLCGYSISRSIDDDRGKDHELTPKAIGSAKTLTAVDPALAAAAGAAVGIGIAAAGDLVSTWVWERYVAPKRKSKNTVKVSVPGDRAHFIGIELESIEERIVRTKRLRIFKGKF